MNQNKLRIREISNSDWPAFCQRLTAERADATVKMEIVEPGDAKSELVSNAIFQSIVFNKTDGCSDGITVRVRGDREVVHEIIEPITIRLQSSGASNDYNCVQIEAESGVTLITIHPPLHSQMLEGFKSV
jgi:hypothetical protein